MCLFTFDLQIKSHSKWFEALILRFIYLFIYLFVFIYLLIYLFEFFQRCRFNLFRPRGLVYCSFLQYKGCLVRVVLLPYLKEIPFFNTNSVSPDQTPHFAASDLDLHCWLMSLLWDARHKWVKVNIYTSKGEHSKRVHSRITNITSCYVNSFAKNNNLFLTCVRGLDVENCFLVRLFFSWLCRGMDTLSGQTTMSELDLPPIWKVVYSEWKEFA